MTEWPATIDSRCHDAVIFDLDCVIAETAADAVEVLDSTVLLLRRLRDLGIATAIYSSSQECAQVLRGAGIDDLAVFLSTKELPESSVRRSWPKRQAGLESPLVAA